MSIDDFVFEREVFSQHTSPIRKTAVCCDKSLIVSIDESLCLFLTQKTAKLEVLEVFSIREIFSAESILDVQVHDIGLILLLCRDSRLLVYKYA